MLDCRKRAIEYWKNRSANAQNGNYFLPFARPSDFKFGENAAYSITMFFVQYYNDNEQYEYPLLGEDPQTVEDSLETERMVFKELGLIQDEISPELLN